jgi:hypothetical protein
MRRATPFPTTLPHVAGVGGLGSARLAQEAEGADSRTMRDVAEYRKRAEDCRQLALKLAAQPITWGLL